MLANGAALRTLCDLPNGSSDEEVLLRLYERWGVGCARKIFGDFAWLLWDGESQVLHACRDRLGVHSLFYRQNGDKIEVAPDIRALLDPGRSRRLRFSAAVAHLHGLHSLAETSFDEGIEVVPPASILSATSRRVEISRYWEVEAPARLRLRDDREYVEAFEQLFLPMVAEYVPPEPFGVTVSSGMDSTSVAAAISEVAPSAAATAVRWISPDVPEADEGEFSAEVVHRLGWPELVLHADRYAPLSDLASLEGSISRPQAGFYPELMSATLNRCKEAGLRTLFTGYPGDFLFASSFYAYLDLLLTGRWIDLWRQVREHLTFTHYSRLRFAKKSLLSPLRQAYLPEPVPFQSSWLTEKARQIGQPKSSYKGPWLPGRRSFLRRLGSGVIPAGAEALELSTQASGVALRHPLMDHRLIEFCASLPLDQSFRAGMKKVLLRNAMKERLPVSITTRRDKIVMTAVFIQGFCSQEGSSRLAKLSRDMRLAELGLVDEAEFRVAGARALASGGVGGAELWPSLTLEAWLRRYF